MTSSELQSLYQEMILDHQKRPHGFGLVEGAAASSHQVNPTCGDEITLELHVAPGTDVVSEVRWTGHGCAISQASASLFTEMAAGHTFGELDTRIDSFRDVMRSRGTLDADEDLLGDAAVLSGVSKYIARVKCAMLAWVAAEHAIAQVRAAA